MTAQPLDAPRSSATHSAATRSHILIIEDEPDDIRRLLCRVLGGAEFHATTAEPGSDGLCADPSEDHDLLILDLILPDLQGEEVLRILRRARPDAGVVVVCSVSEVGRKIGALEMGDVDVVSKPFSNAELLARVQLRLRTEQRRADEHADYLVIDTSTRLDLTRLELLVAGRRVKLSQREFGLLKHLADRRGRVCTRQELLSDVWGIGFDTGTNLVDVNIARLRNKLPAAEVIETVRNSGYRLTPL